MEVRGQIFRHLSTLSTRWGPGIELTSSVLVANKHLYQLNHIVGTPCWLIDNSDRLHAAAWVAASQVRARRVRTPLGYPASLPISYSLLSPQMFSAGLFSTLLCSPFRSLPRPMSPSLPPTINRLYIRSVAWLDCSGGHLGRCPLSPHHAAIHKTQDYLINSLLYMLLSCLFYSMVE